MQSNLVRFPWEIPKNAVVATVGIIPLVLRQPYDDRQLWLPFVNFLIIYLKPDPIHERENTSTKLKKGIARQFALVSPKERQLFMPEKGVPQLILPFFNWKIVSQSQYQYLHTANFPGWERNSNNSIYAFSFNREKKSDLIDFLNTNSKGRFGIIKGERVYFELKIDFAMAKIIFSG